MQGDVGSWCRYLGAMICNITCAFAADQGGYLATNALPNSVAVGTADSAADGAADSAADGAADGTADGYPFEGRQPVHGRDVLGSREVHRHKSRELCL